MKLIKVNADDFGIEDTSSFAILECFKRGWLDSTTAMMNMPECAEAEQLAHDKGYENRVGVHLNLTWGTPMTDTIKRLPMFCDGDGQFTGAFHQSIKSRLWLSGNAKDAVAAELRAQVAAYVKSGFCMMHADSHHHVHMDYSILPIVIAILKENNFKSIRIGRNIGSDMSIGNRIYKQLVNSCVCRSGLGYTRFFGSPFDAVNDSERIVGASVELMVHPTYRCNGERAMGGQLCDYMRPIDETEMAIQKLRQEI